MGIPKDHSLLAAYPKGDSNGYGRSLAEKRFSVLLKDLKFTNVLDVGSGACFLKTWLQKSDISANYEAVDIRPEALALCDCTTYSATPRKGAYDLICLIGTVTYNLDNDVLKNKQILKTLLKAAKKVGTGHILFTVFKDSVAATLSPNDANKFVYFSKEELTALVKKVGLNLVYLKEIPSLDPNEYFVLCSK